MKVGDLIKDHVLGRHGIIVARLTPRIVSRSKGPVVVNYYRVLYDDGQMGRACPSFDDIEVVS